MAKTAYGSIRLDEVVSGSVEAESAYGEVGVGVRAGVPAWLDLASKNGRVRNELEADRAPVRVRAVGLGARPDAVRRRQRAAYGGGARHAALTR